MRESFPDDESRLTETINKKMAYYLPGRSDCFLAYAPWLLSPQCLAVKFENLYPDIRALNDGKLGTVLRGLLEYLEVDCEIIDPHDVYGKVFGRSITAFDLEEKIGQKKQVFSQGHYALIDRPEFRQILDTFGYEW